MANEQLFHIDPNEHIADGFLSLIAGDRDEVRKALGSFGQLMRAGPQFVPTIDTFGQVFNLIADALIEIGKGADANVAFRLQKSSRDKTGIQKTVNLLRMVRHLVDQGASEADALKMIAAFNLAHSKQLPVPASAANRAIGGVAADSELKKEIGRLRKAFRTGKKQFWIAKGIAAGMSEGADAAKRVLESGCVRKKAG